MKKDKLFVKNLSNKQPTKDISLDDIKFKLKEITSKKTDFDQNLKKYYIFKKKYSNYCGTKWS